MKTGFDIGAQVRFKKTGDRLIGTLCAPDNDSAYISPGKRASQGIRPEYIGEGFYCVSVLGKKLICHEDDLILDSEA